MNLEYEKYYADINQRLNSILQEFNPELIQKAREKLEDFERAFRYPDAVIAFSHSNYLNALGGTEKVLNQEQRQLSELQISYIQVFGIPEEWNVRRIFPEYLVGVTVDRKYVGNFSILQLAYIISFLQKRKNLCVLAAHVHHLMHLVPAGVKFLLRVTRPKKIRIFVHDYYMICPQINLLKDGKEFCFAECDASCKVSDAKSIHFPIMVKFLKELNPEIIIPSQVASQIWTKTFIDYKDQVRIVPHLLEQKGKNNINNIDRLLESDYKVKIAYLGYESMVKGLEIWWSLVENRSFQKYYEFFHFGAAAVKKPGVKYVEVSFLEDGDDAMIRALRKYEIDVAFLWSICPETYSFTLYEALSAGCFVLTNPRSGNIAEKIRSGSTGVILEDEIELRQFLQNSAKFKSLLIKNFKASFRLELRPNPKIANETAELRDPVSKTKEGDGEKRFFPNKFDNENCLLGLFALEMTRCQNKEVNGKIQTNIEIPDESAVVWNAVAVRLKYLCQKSKHFEKALNKLVEIFLDIFN